MTGARSALIALSLLLASGASAQTLATAPCQVGAEIDSARPCTGGMAGFGLVGPEMIAPGAPMVAPQRIAGFAPEGPAVLEPTGLTAVASTETGMDIDVETTGSIRQ